MQRRKQRKRACKRKSKQRHLDHPVDEEADQDAVVAVVNAGGERIRGEIEELKPVVVLMVPNKVQVQTMLEPLKPHNGITIDASGNLAGCRARLDSYFCVYIRGKGHWIGYNLGRGYLTAWTDGHGISWPTHAEPLDDRLMLQAPPNI